MAGSSVLASYPGPERELGNGFKVWTSIVEVFKPPWVKSVSPTGSHLGPDEATPTNPDPPCVPLSFLPSRSSEKCRVRTQWAAMKLGPARTEPGAKDRSSVLGSGRGLWTGLLRRQLPTDPVAPMLPRRLAARVYRLRQWLTWPTWVRISRKS